MWIFGISVDSGCWNCPDGGRDVLLRSRPGAVPVLQENPGADGSLIPPSAAVGKFLFPLIPGIIPKIRGHRFPFQPENPSFLSADFLGAQHTWNFGDVPKLCCCFIHVIPTARNGEIQAPNDPEREFPGSAASSPGLGKFCRGCPKSRVLRECCSRKKNEGKANKYPQE